MCDFSLQAFESRPAVIGEELVTTNWGTGTVGFAAAGGPSDVAVCVLPGTELAFDEVISVAVMCMHTRTQHRVARFVQVDKDKLAVHHDAVELPDGCTIKLATLVPGQRATVLQLPAAPRTREEVEAQRRAEFVG